MPTAFHLRNVRVVLYCALSCVLVASAAAQESTVELDPAATKIEFTLAASLHTVHGTFTLKSGTVHFDPATGQASGLIVVDVKSGQTDNDTRDRKMHTEVLQSERYPEATFSPTRFSGTLLPQGASTVQVDGVFHIHGADHACTWPVAVEVSGDSVTARIHAEIPYVSWGMKNPSTFFLRVSDKIKLDITANGSFSKPRTAH